MKFEPQCKTRADLHREMARVLDMCAGFARISNYPLYLDCVKYNGSVPSHYDGLPHLYMEDIGKYEFALAIVEGKPVFRGDVIYDSRDGRKITAVYVSAVGCLCEADGMWVDYPSWNPPQRTIEINGVKVNRHTDITIYDFLEYLAVVNFKTPEDAEAFKDALEGKK